MPAKDRSSNPAAFWISLDKDVRYGKTKKTTERLPSTWELKIVFGRFRSFAGGCLTWLFHGPVYPHAWFEKHPQAFESPHDMNKDGFGPSKVGARHCATKTTSQCFEAIEAWVIGPVTINVHFPTASGVQSLQRSLAHKCADKRLEHQSEVC